MNFPFQELDEKLTTYYIGGRIELETFKEAKRVLKSAETLGETFKENYLIYQTNITTLEKRLQKILSGEYYV